MKVLGAMLAIQRAGHNRGFGPGGAVIGSLSMYPELQRAGAGSHHPGRESYDLNLVNEVGEPSRGWIDRPSHIWADDWHEGAIIAPDGMTIQFDNGAVWQRFVPPPPLPPATSCRRGSITASAI